MLETRNRMAGGRPKGTPKTGGRTKKTCNKATERKRDFRERLESKKIDLETELAKAILSKDIDLIRALAQLLPYLAPRLKETDQPVEDTPAEDNEDPAQILQLLKTNLEPNE